MGEGLGQQANVGELDAHRFFKRFQFLKCFNEGIEKLQKKSRLKYINGDGSWIDWKEKGALYVPTTSSTRKKEKKYISSSLTRFP